MSSGGTHIIINRNGYVSREKLGCVIDNLFQIHDAKKFGVLDVSSENLYVPSIKEESNNLWKKILFVHKYKVINPTMSEIITVCNRSYIGDANQLFSYCTKQEDNCHNKSPVLQCGYINIHNTLVISMFYIPECITQSLPIQKSIMLNRDSGYLIGRYLSIDGSISLNESSVVISYKDIEDIECIERIGLEYYKVEFILKNTVKPNELHISHTELNMYIIANCGFGVNKRIPDIAFGSNTEFIHGLVCGYIKCESMLFIDCILGVVSIGSVHSPHIIYGLSYILTIYNIYNSVLYESNWFKINITENNAKMFLLKFLPDTDIRVKEWIIFRGNLTECNQCTVNVEVPIRSEKRISSSVDEYVYGLSLEDNAPIQLYNGILVSSYNKKYPYILTKNIGSL